eukprot:TRINITY_DN1772_c0_g2_i2.p1 TRINITY_DN1772_c0_g2~~TRINITY_DN1772_c0_g2_i2.p1  ORF type:complete len:143 (-),score=1.36 TRINITY_DN1772_c0_g2_i2:29-457(-)
MDNPVTAANEVLRILRDPGGFEGAFQTVAKQFLDCCFEADHDPASDAVGVLAEAFASLSAKAAAHAALLCGMLVESGLRPPALADALIEKLDAVLQDACALGAWLPVWPVACFRVFQRCRYSGRSVDYRANDKNVVIALGRR